MRHDRAKRDFQILVVEDDEDLRISVAQVLADEGYAVSVAQNGKAALSLLHAPGGEPPDLILLDLVTPIVDGIELLERTSREAQFAGIPVLVVSAGAFNKKHLPAGVSVDVLKKPFGLETLLSKVASVLAARSKS